MVSFYGAPARGINSEGNLVAHLQTGGPGDGDAMAPGGTDLLQGNNRNFGIPRQKGSSVAYLSSHFRVKGGAVGQ